MTALQELVLELIGEDKHVPMAFAAITSAVARRIENPVKERAVDRALQGLRKLGLIRCAKATRNMTHGWLLCATQPSGDTNKKGVAE